MKVSTKKVGFKLLPENSGEDCHGDEEKKTDDGLNVSFSASPPQQLTPSFGKSSRMESPPTLAISQKQVSTPSTCSPASSAASTPTNNGALADTNNNTNNSKGFRRKFRLPRYFSRRRSSGTSIQCEASEEEEATGEEPENDPVMAVFQSRYKNRVRWSLDDQPVAEKYTPEKKPNDGKDAEAANSTKKNEETVNDKAATVRDSQLASGPPTGTGGSTSAKSSNTTSGSNSMSIKKFVTGALFGGAGNSKSASDKEFQNEVAKEVEAEKDLVWESNTVSPEGGEILYTSHRKAASPESQLTIAFSEDPKTRTDVLKLIKKGKRAQSEYYRYEYAVNYFVRAVDMLTEAKYPEMHPTVRKALDCLNDAHHKLSSFNNSANIVKIGIKYEDAGELVRALKMYSIAYRIRRDNLSRTHPSLVVLLNMLGSIQTKRGEYEEAMKIYELALKDTSKQDQLSLEYPDTLALTPTAMSSASAQDNDDDEASHLPPPPPPVAPQPSQLEHDSSSNRGNLLARSVTYREMGTIFEKWDRREEALRMYHLSLDCVAEWKEAAGISSEDKGLQLLNSEDSVDDNANRIEGSGELDKFMDTVHVKKSYASLDHDDQTMEKGEMEIGLAIVAVKNTDAKAATTSTSSYDYFFPAHLEAINAKKGRSTASAAAMARGDTEGIDRRDDYADIDVALTIHQIAQLFRKEGDFSKSLEAYAVALRAMKYCLGSYHPNVAAVLGNYGNLQKEMGDLNAAYDTYQEVLGIESYRLGLSHPDVAITLHNIATIDSARGNHERALKLYEQVMCLQKKLFGRDHISIAVTSACMGDVYEALGQMKDAFESYEDALRIKSELQGNHSLEAARLLHKLAKVALKRGDHRLACNYISRAIFVYRLNKIPDDHEWVVDGHRDSADIDASIALAKNMTYEC